MAEKIEVHFTSDQKKMRAVVDPKIVKAVFISSTAAISPQTFANAHGLQFDPTARPTTPPNGVKVFNEKETITDIQGMEGPGVCYWVENQLVCW